MTVQQDLQDIQQEQHLINQIIEQRLREVVKLELREKCQTLAQELSTRHGDYHIAKLGDTITLEYNGHANNINVKVNDELVFKVQLGHVKAYRPGGWVRVILRNYEKIDEQIKARELQQKKQELKEQMQCFGITPDEIRTIVEGRD